MAAKVRDNLVTVVAVWLALAVAGAIGEFAPTRDAASWIASAAFVALLSVFAFWSGPGRRSRAGIYMAAGIALLPISLAILFGILATEQYELAWLLVGGNVGYNPGGMDSGMLFGGLFWWITVLALIGLSLLPRLLVDL